MANYYLEHHDGKYILSPEGNKAAGITFRTQTEGIEYAKKNYPSPHHGLHVERVEYLEKGQPPRWRKVH